MSTPWTTFLITALFGACLASAQAAELEIHDITVGNGDTAVANSRVRVHYTGWLSDGTEFDSSRFHGKPFEFQLGSGRVIPGWEQGMLGMRVGGKRELIIPPELAYGARGASDVIPPYATLRFEVELLAVNATAYTNVDPAQLRAKLAAGVKLFDVRNPDEWAATGVVEGAIRVTAFDNAGRVRPEFVEELKRQVQPGQEFAVMCHSGGRSSALSELLSTRGGYTHVLNLDGGILAWQQAGLPLVPSK